MSDEIYYNIGLLGQFNHNSTHQRSPYNGYTCRRSKFEVLYIYAFIDHLENPFIPVHFNAIHTLKSQNG